MAETIRDTDMTGAAAPDIVEMPVVAQASLTEAATTAGGIDAAAEQAASPSAEELAIARSRCGLRGLVAPR